MISISLRSMLASLVLINSSFAQIQTKKVNSGNILSELHRGSISAEEIEVKLAEYDFSKLVEEDKTSEKRAGRPFRFGKDFDVQLTLSSGNWKVIDGMLIWRLKISSPTAKSLNLIFSTLSLNETSKIFIYNSDLTMITGPITRDNLVGSNQFWSEVIEGSSIIIELQTVHKEGNALRISKVIHGYKELIVPTSGFGDAAPCNIDINCPAASSFHQVSNAVARTLVNNGTEFCSGTLVNNACQDLRPFFLTGFHCFDSNANDILDSGEINAIQDVTFRFQYKSPEPQCDGLGGGSDATVYYTFNGATLRSAWFDADFSLVELSQAPAISSGIVYAGWNRSTSGITQTAIISHSRGDVMKIAYDSNSPIFTNFSLVNHPVGFFWETNTSDPGDYGTTERGSSGAGIFDQNGRLIGQQFAATEDPNEQNLGRCTTARKTFCGRFDLSWNGGGTSATQLSSWLSNDPNVSAINTIAIPFISGPDLLCTSGIFTLNNPPGSTITWAVTPSNLVSPSSGNGTTASVSRISIGDATIQFNFGCSSNIPRIFHAGPYSSSDYPIAGPGNATCNQYVYYTMPILPGATSYNWAWPSEWSYVSGQGTNQLALYTGSYSSYFNAVLGGVDNTCGQSGSYDHIYTFVSGGCDSGFTASPNPASDELTVTFKEEEGIADEKDFETENEITLYNQRQERIYIVKSLKKKVVIPVKNLPDGVYVLTVSNTEGAVAQQVLIEHK